MAVIGGAAGVVRGCAVAELAGGSLRDAANAGARPQAARVDVVPALRLEWVMADDGALREQLIALLRGGHAHATFDQVVEGFPVAQAGIRPPGAPYSAWELLEHMRIAQNDILRFSQSAEYESPKWPEGYWPEGPAPPKAEDWDRSVRSFHQDLAEFEALIRDPGKDLNRKFPWGDGQTLLRETLLLADHNAYHLGQLVLVRRLLGAWQAG